MAEVITETPTFPPVFSYPPFSVDFMNEVPTTATEIAVTLFNTGLDKTCSVVSCHPMRGSCS